DNTRSLPILPEPWLVTGSARHQIGELHHGNLSSGCHQPPITGFTRTTRRRATPCEAFFHPGGVGRCLQFPSARWRWVCPAVSAGRPHHPAPDPRPVASSKARLPDLITTASTPLPPRPMSWASSVSALAKAS